MGTDAIRTSVREAGAMDFTSSSHRNKWILSEVSLKALRKAANKKGIDNVMSLRRMHELPVDGFSPLTTQEEHEYVSMHTRILAAEWRKRYPPKVVATAVTFVRRFFVYHSCMEHDVINVLFACLYTSGKVCEHYIDAGSMAQAFPKAVKAADVLQYETVVLSGLQFDLVVYQPYHYVTAMIEEIRCSLAAQDPDLVTFHTTLQQRQTKLPEEATPEKSNNHRPELLTLTARDSRSCLDSMMHSDAPLLISPQQQALCAVCVALQSHGMPRNVCVQRYTAQISDEAGVQAAAATALEEVLARAARFAEEGNSALDMTELHRLCAKLKHINPLMDRTSQLYADFKRRKRTLEMMA